MHESAADTSLRPRRLPAQNFRLKTRFAFSEKIFFLSTSLSQKMLSISGAVSSSHLAVSGSLAVPAPGQFGAEHSAIGRRPAE